MTIAVIGHGRSPEGRRWGSRIDECCTVVRMWDWTPWQKPVDYGEVYSYGLFVLTPKGLKVFNETDKPSPYKGWLAYMGKPTSGLLPGPPPVEMVDTQRWCSMAREMGGAGLSGRLTLTRGCVAAAWAIEKSTMYSSPQVVLVGFDNVQCGINQPVEQSFCPEYWNLYNARFASKIEKVYPIGTAKTATHDMTIELPLLARIAKANGVSLKFAQEVW